MVAVRFLKMLIMHLYTGSLKSTFSKYSFGREGQPQKEYSLYAFDNVDNYGRPLT